MRVGSFRFTLAEFGGALGDLGTLLPLLAALIAVNGVSATGAFFVAGLAYIMAGLWYRIPVPVQPLKAVSAIAIASGLSASLISASGLLMAGMLLALAGTGAVALIARLFPRPVIRGIQLGVALLLIKAAFSLVNRKEVFIGGPDAWLNAINMTVPLGWLIATACVAVLFFFLRKRVFPASLAVIGSGLVVGAWYGAFTGLADLRLGMTLPGVNLPGLPALASALVLLVIPQLPLTLGNAVFASADTARSYFGPRACRVTPRNLPTTMGVSNIAAGFLGGVPLCHGSGGFTAHFKLGARTGGANIMIGALLLAMALFLDGRIVPVLALVPYSVLGVLLAFVGVQHALLAKNLKGKREITVCLVVAVAGVATRNLAIGLAAGIALYQLFRLVGKETPVAPLPEKNWCSVP